MLSYMTEGNSERRFPQIPGGCLGTQWRRRASSSEVIVAALRARLGSLQEKGPWGMWPCAHPAALSALNSALTASWMSGSFLSLQRASSFFCVALSHTQLSDNETLRMVWMHGRLLCWGHQPSGGIRSLWGDVTSVISTLPDPCVFLKLRWLVIK